MSRTRKRRRGSRGVRSMRRMVATVLGLNTPISARIFGTQPANIIGYLPLGDPSGTNADDISSTNADGTYTGTFTLAQAGIGDGSRSTLFGGGRVSLATNLAALNTAMDKTQGTIFAWGKVSGAGVWTDGVSRFLIELGADANNRVFMTKNTGSNLLSIVHVAGTTTKQIDVNTSTTLNWFSVALTWDKAADQVKAYFNGVQSGSTLTGLGVWVGSLSSTFSAIAEFNSAGTSNSWSGNLAHVAIWKIALTATEVARIGIL